MFSPHPPQTTETVCIEFEGEPLHVPSGISVSAAVLGHTSDGYCRRSIISGQERAPYCLIGVCHECLMDIDGKPYQQACMITVKDGMKIKKQNFRGGQ